MAGLHPWKNLPDLLLNLVYQGRYGQLLLERDSVLLGLTLVSEQAVLMQLAAKAGDSTRQALQAALQIKDGSKTVQSVELAKTIKERVLHEAKKTGKLAAKELKLLGEGARSAVDTGYGTAHEDGALDLYETQCGWPVEQRNSELREWPFAKLEDAPETNSQEQPRTEKATVVPLAHASCANWKPAVEIPAVAKEEADPNSCSSKQATVEDLTKDDAVVSDTVPSETARNKDLRPFFWILGSVDGIRDELAPCATRSAGGDSPSDDDSWVLRKVVVECKHRMSRIHAVPPLYEQIQTTAYCLMHQVTEADIVQVLRKERVAKRKGAPQAEVQSTTLDGWVQKGSNNEEKELPAPPAAAAKENARTVTITVSRISLEDPIMQHRANWTQVVLPRLRSFVEAVFSIRSNDNLRYQLLVSLSDTTDDDKLKSAWHILHDKCPWLESCDTAYHRING
jgi:hypothetical protein